MRGCIPTTASILAISVGTAAAADRPVSIRTTGGFRLDAVFSTPDGPGPFPAAMIIDGFGPDNRDGGLQGTLYRDWADALVARGVAVLRYDKRGLGASTGPALSWLNPLVMRADAVAATRVLARLPDVDRTHLALIGHSQGGDLALAAAWRVPAIDRVITLAAPGRPLGDFANAGQLAVLGRIVGTKAARATARLDPLDDARRVRQPTLVVQGTADRVVPIGDSLRIVSARRKRRLPTALLQIPGLGHQIQDLKTRRPPTSLVDRTAAFIGRARPGRSRPPGSQGSTTPNPQG